MSHRKRSPKVPQKKKRQRVNKHNAKKPSFPRKNDLVAAIAPVELRCCAHCGCIIQNPRNKDYCSNECRLKARRIIDNDKVAENVTHGFWLKVQKMIKDSRDGLDSISGLCSIRDIVNLYSRLAWFQRSYNAVNDVLLINNKTGLPADKLQADLELQLGHLYPKNLGGRNDSCCFILSIKVINKAIGGCVFEPGSEWARKIFFSEKLISATQGQKMSGDLLKALVLKFGKNEVEEMIVSLSLPVFDKSTVRNYRQFETPLLDMMLKEFTRLNMGYLARTLQRFLFFHADKFGHYDEVIALACNIAMQTQDTHGLLNAIRCYRSDLGSRSGKNILERTSGYIDDEGNMRDIYEGSQLYDILERTRQAIKTILKVDALLRPQDMERLYKSLFSVTPDKFTLPQLPMIAKGSAFHPEHPQYQTAQASVRNYRHCPPPAKLLRKAPGSIN
ncbi:hypothetical protein JGW18_000314 [Salmonella enterica]|nr:hypothetical protein [Salmonella enterica]